MLWTRGIGVTVLALVFGGYVLSPDLAIAEWFGDLYGGAAFPEGTTARFDQRYPTAAAAKVNLNMGTAPTFGGRVGRWSDTPLVGIALDVSYFQRKAATAKIDVVPISVLFMLRLPFYRSDDFPKGQLQPYVGIGPSLFVASGTIESPGSGIDAVNQGRTDFGFDVRAGVSWQVNKYLAVFSEYRFTDVNLRFLDRRCLAASCTPLGTDIISETKVSLATHHLMVGIRF